MRFPKISNQTIIVGIFILIFGGIVGYDTYSRYHIAQSEASRIVVDTTQANPSPVVVSEPSSEPSPASISFSPTPKPTTKPTIKPSPTPTPTPTPMGDFFFESAKMTYRGHDIGDLVDEGEGPVGSIFMKGMVRNYDIRANTGTVNMKVYYDGKIIVEKERRLFDEYYWYEEHLIPKDLGEHTVKIVYNENRAIPETNYSHNEQVFHYRVIADGVPPTFTIDGPYNIDGQTCMRWVNLTDNAFVYTDVWAKYKIDDGAWSEKSTGTVYGCVTGTTGETHTYTVRAEDLRGNIREESKQFSAY